MPCRAETADPDNWRWAFYASSSYQNSSTLGAGGVSSAATDGYDSADDWLITSGSRMYVGTHHVNGVYGWTGETGFYSSDIRAPLQMQPGTSKLWTLYVWADPSVPADASYTRLYWDNYYALSDQLSFSIRVKANPAGVTGGPAVGTQWDLSAQPHGVLTLPVFRTSNGLEGYAFDFTATVIPEPPSLLALSAFLAPLAGLAVRRRR